MNNTRRGFLSSCATLAAAAGVPYFHSTPRTLADETKSKNDRFTIGLIGAGGMGVGNLRSAAQWIDVVAIADADSGRAASANEKLAGGKAQVYDDYRRILERKDVDVLHIATPDHWHTKPLVEALRAGKDVYCEKPLTYNVREAVELVKAVRATNRVFQVGSQQRSAKEFRVAAELVRNGLIGRVHAVGVSFGDPARPYDKPAEPVEPGLDWNLWCGPGPLVNYNPMLSPRGVHNHFPHWRNTWGFGGGMITDWGAHHIDIAQWALDKDENGPVEVRAPRDWQTAKRGAQLVYADGTVLTHVKGKGVSFYGTEGEIHVNRGKFEFVRDAKVIHKFWDKEVDKGTSLEREVTLTEREFLADAKVKLYNSKSHFQDFMDAVVSRKRPICDVAIGASTAIACHVMNFAYHYGANAKWDPVRNKFAGFNSGGDSRWLTRERYRDNWGV